MKKLNGWCIPKAKGIHVPLLNGYDHELMFGGYNSRYGIEYHPARYWTKNGAYHRKDQIYDADFPYPITIMRTHTWFKPYQIFILKTQAANDFKQKKPLN